MFEVSWSIDLDVLATIAALWDPDLIHLHSFWMWHIAEGLREGSAYRSFTRCIRSIAPSTSSAPGRLNASGNGSTRNR